MGLETGSWISDLVVTNPVSGDNQSQGDDHLRLLKTLLKATFPTASKAFYFPTTASKSANYTVLAADMHTTFLVTTTSGAVTMTLPSLASGDAGWECYFVKVTTDTYPMFITPPSGTIQSGEYSGLTKTRRCIPGRKTRVWWSGTAWFADRVVSEPLGAVIDFSLASTPVGYELAYGQTLTSASTNYPDFYAANGNSGVVIDMRGRVGAGQDDMGGTSANRLTGLTDGVNGDTFGAAGGLESTTLTIAQMPAHDHGGTTGAAGGHTQARAGGSDAAGGSDKQIAVSETISNHTHSISSQGSGAAHNNVQPTIIVNKLVVVE